MEEIIRIIRQADGDKTVREVCREHNVHEVTFHRWKRKYGGLKLEDAQKLKGLERENAELQKMLAETRDEKTQHNQKNAFLIHDLSLSAP